MSNQRFLITGGLGFLGRAVAKRCKVLGHYLVGVGHGCLSPAQALEIGYDHWINADLSLSSLEELDGEFDCVVHCAGNSSVAYSLNHPFQDFFSSVQATAELLEFLHRTNSKARVVYPSTAGVYGAVPDDAIKETDPLSPISTYGYHKRIVEELLEMHSVLYGVQVSIIRFFSIYGESIKKQLLWDASNKLLSSDDEAVFWGTGEETRDWIHIDDAVELVLRMSRLSERFFVANGASGDRVTVREILMLLRNELNSPALITFNGEMKPGDPRFYHADVSMLDQLGFRPRVLLSSGISRYANWVKKHSD